VKLAIAQDFEYIGNDYWRWRAWIEGKPSDLDAIEKVTWFLHPTKNIKQREKHHK